MHRGDVTDKERNFVPVFPCLVCYIVLRDQLQTKGTSMKRVCISARRSIGGSAEPEVDRPCGTAIDAH